MPSDINGNKYEHLIRRDFATWDAAMDYLRDDGFQPLTKHTSYPTPAVWRKGQDVWARIKVKHSHVDAEDNLIESDECHLHVIRMTGKRE